MNINAILNLFFPRLCLNCEISGAYLCSKCFNDISLIKSQSCPNCRRGNNSGVFCSPKCAKGYHFNQLIVCFGYEKNSLLKKLVVMFKYKFSKELSMILGRLMKHQFAYYSHLLSDRENLILVPVPLHKNRFKYRGFNQAKLLAEYLADHFNNLELSDCLLRNVNLKQQAKLSQSQRLINVRNTIFMKNSFENLVKGRTVVLIDDIATTCSTLNECSRVLKNYGAKHVCGLVLARGWMYL